MANTTSAKKATRKIARRTEINKARRSRMRSSVRKVEEAIAAGDRSKALDALKAAEPVIMRAAQKGVVHRNTRQPQGVAPDPAGRQARQIARARPRLFQPVCDKRGSKPVPAVAVAQLSRTQC